MMNNQLDLNVKDPAECIRLDQFLQTVIPEQSRSYIQSLIKSGEIQVNQKEVKTGYKLKLNDRITGKWQEKKSGLLPQPENIPLDIVFEDEHLAVINKPAGMVVHPAPGNYEHTLVNALLYHFKNLSNYNRESRPGIVHRIDKDTSGLIMIAKNNQIHKKLGELFQERKITKKYLTLVWNLFEQKKGEINLPIGRDPKERTKFTVHGISPRDALTFYQVLDDFIVFSLVEVQIVTGRTHQIRVHFSHQNHPVLGDEVYSQDKGFSKNIQPVYKPLILPIIKNVHHQLLHAYKMSFIHPLTNEELNLCSSVPQDFQAVVDQLRLVKEKTIASYE